MTWFCFLALISLPGLILWTPVFITATLAVRRDKTPRVIRRTSLHKMRHGFASALLICLLTMSVTWRVARLSAPLVPIIMWLTLRWLEDAMSVFRTLNSLFQLSLIGSVELARIRTRRELLHARLMALVQEVGLPQDPEQTFRERGSQKGRVGGGKWESYTRYFSLERRGKRDWNETLRWYDLREYPDDF
jgi:glycerol-3-phosphate O-acyltransferase/dihydroxyacetone phosphate acyltransferase